MLLPAESSDSSASSISTEDVPAQKPAEDELKFPWLVSVLGHVVLLCTLGFGTAFGAFQTRYVSTLHQPPAVVSWIGSVQIFLMFFLATVSGRLSDAGYFPQLLQLGGLCVVLGIMLASVSTTLWELVLTQGVLVGLGCGALLCPVMSVVSVRSGRWRPVALGIVSCGGATGGILIPLIIKLAVPSIGFPWTTRLIGFLFLFLLGTVCVLFPAQSGKRKGREWLDRAAFRQAPFVLYGTGMFFVCWALFFGYFYVGLYGRTRMGISFSKSMDMIMIVNALGILGRIIPSLVAFLWLGSVTTIALAAAGTGVVMFGWIGVGSQIHVYIFECFYGFAAGAVIGLFPLSVADLTTDAQKMGTRSGMIFSLVSFACLSGGPVGGRLISVMNGRYLAAQCWAGSSLLLGTVFLLLSRRCSGKVATPSKC